MDAKISEIKVVKELNPKIGRRASKNNVFYSEAYKLLDNSPVGDWIEFTITGESVREKVHSLRGSFVGHLKYEIKTGKFPKNRKVTIRQKQLDEFNYLIAVSYYDDLEVTA